MLSAQIFNNKEHAVGCSSYDLCQLADTFFIRGRISSRIHYVTDSHAPCHGCDSTRILAIMLCLPDNMED